MSLCTQLGESSTSYVMSDYPPVHAPATDFVLFYKHMGRY